MGQIRRAGKIFCGDNFLGVFATNKFVQIPLLQNGGYNRNTDSSSSPSENG